ncbi:MAG: hypothetical protein J5J00_16905 [Deltaproteobacteria bacterium]|nr:hypothetical protein [Deltaproteobacteria bacterium]
MAGKSHSTGSVLVEFLLLFMVVVVVTFSGIHLALNLKAGEILSTLSRESAKLAAARCAGLNDPAPCIDVVLADLDISAQTLLPGSAIVISVYEVDVAANVVAFIASRSTSPHVTSRYNANRFAALTLSRADLAYLTSFRKRLVLSEVFFSRKVSMPILNYIMGDAIGDSYELSIY